MPGHMAPRALGVLERTKARTGRGLGRHGVGREEQRAGGLAVPWRARRR